METFPTLSQLIKHARKRERSFSDITAEYLGRITKLDAGLHSFLSVDKKGALAAAKSADDAFDEKNSSELFGMPYAVKDNILVQGLPCTAASKMLKDYVAPYEATVVSSLRSAGALVLGKTNMDEFAMGSSTEHSAFGATKNPVDPTRVPGGSSGGSAAAVAAGLTPFALGSDTGGSIRQPAAFCGVVGFKPTYGAVSRHGLMAMASSLDHIGTLTRTVEDAKIIAPYIMGEDVLDATSQPIPAKLTSSLKPTSLTIGVAKEHFGEGLDERVEKSIKKAIGVYEKMGARVQEISLPHARYALPVYYIVMPSEVSSNMARYDGIRYGLHKESEDLYRHYTAIRREGLGDEVRLRVMLGTYVLSAGYYDAYYLKAQKVRTLIAQDYEKAFQNVDVIMSPTTPALPFKLGEKLKDPLQMYLADVYTVSANLVGIPAVSIPVGTVEEDGTALPVGLHISGPQKQDMLVLEVASWHEQQ